MIHSKIGYPNSSTRVFYKTGKIHDIPDALAKSFISMKVAKEYIEPIKSIEEVLDNIWEDRTEKIEEKQEDKSIRRMKKRDR